MKKILSMIMLCMMFANTVFAANIYNNSLTASDVSELTDVENGRVGEVCGENVLVWPSSVSAEAKTTITLPEAIEFASGTKTCISFKQAWTGGTVYTLKRYFDILDSDGNTLYKRLWYVNKDIGYDPTYESKKYSFESDSEYVKNIGDSDAWFDISIVIRTDSNGSSKAQTIIKGYEFPEVDVTGKDINSIILVNGKGSPDERLLAIKDLSINQIDYTLDYEYNNDDRELTSVRVENYSGETLDAQIYVSQYDDDNVLLGIDMYDVDMEAGTIQETMLDKKLDENTKLLKIMLWKGMKPVVSMQKETPYIKYIHISFDDVITSLKEITETEYESVFDHKLFKNLKYLHDTYGAVFTLNCFNTGSSFDISDMTDRYADEFKANTSWLKFAFHAEKSSTHYGVYNNSAATDTVEEAVASYNKFTAAVINFTGTVDAIDTVTRLGNFAGELEYIQAFKQCDYGITGLTTADSSGRNSYYFDNELYAELNLTNYMNSYDSWYDEKEDIIFVKSNSRVERVAYGNAKFEAINLDENSINKNQYVELFTHESSYTEFLNDDGSVIETSEKGYYSTPKAMEEYLKKAQELKYINAFISDMF